MSVKKKTLTFGVKTEKRCGYVERVICWGKDTPRGAICRGCEH